MMKIGAGNTTIVTKGAGNTTIVTKGAGKSFLFRELAQFSS